METTVKWINMVMFCCLFFISFRVLLWFFCFSLCVFLVGVFCVVIFFFFFVCFFFANNYIGTCAQCVIFVNDH